MTAEIQNSPSNHKPGKTQWIGDGDFSFGICDKSGGYLRIVKITGSKKVTYYNNTIISILPFQIK